MKRTARVAAYFTLSLWICSCAFHSGMMTSNAHLSENNFQIVKTVTAYAGTMHILGIGGMDKTALVAEAKSKLYNDFPLDPGQVFANISVDFKRSFYLVVWTTDVFVSADLVQFTYADSKGPLPIVRTEIQTTPEIVKDFFKLDDEVCFYNRRSSLSPTCGHNMEIKNNKIWVDIGEYYKKADPGEIYITGAARIAELKLEKGKSYTLPRGSQYSNGTLLGLAVNGAVLATDQSTLIIPLDSLGPLVP